jgi:hypothetical protein
MARYIDADKLKQDLGEEPLNWTDSDAEMQEQVDYKMFKSLIESQPTADVEEVVRCKDCKHYKSEYINCWVMRAKMKPSDFCSYGEKALKEREKE